MGYFGIPFRNGVPIGLGSVASFGAQQFDPSSLFIGGTAGTWYDPSDPTTLFTTSTGTTPCAVPGSGSQVLVGLMLDKSQGAPGALGAELVTTPYSGSTSGTWTISSTSVTRNSSATGQASLFLSTTVDTTKRYLVSFTVANLSGDTFFYRVGGGGTAYQITANGVYTARVLGGGTASNIIFAPWAGSAGEATITNISVREIPGNHAIAFNDTTARPELRARVNLLEYSEEFGNAWWAAIGGTVSADTTTAPNGTLTADTFTASATTARHSIVSNVLFAIPSGLPCTFRVAIKKGNYNFITLIFGRTGTTWITATFDFSSGVPVVSKTGAGASGSTNISSAVAASENGFFILTLTGSIVAADAFVSVALASSANPTYGGFGEESWTAAGTETVIVWGADLRPANIGANVPAYQRIADANTYDSNGFPSYLRFDGVDDSMYTPASINFSGTDKMSVFAGVRKLSDVGAQVISELSSNVGSNNGSFATFANVDAAGGTTAGAYGGILKGTTAYIGADALSLNAPISNVVAQQMNIAAASDAVVFRIDGVQVDTSGGASAGTGNFGTYPLYIGSRGNSGLRFNGHLYSLVVVGSAVPAGSITATEQYVAGKTGVQI